MATTLKISDATLKICDAFYWDNKRFVITVDVTKLDALARKAYASKGRKASVCHGAIIVKFSSNQETP